MKEIKIVAIIIAKMLSIMLACFLVAVVEEIALNKKVNIESLFSSALIIYFAFTEYGKAKAKNEK